MEELNRIRLSKLYKQAPGFWLQEPRSLGMQEVLAWVSKV